MWALSPNTICHIIPTRHGFVDPPQRKQNRKNSDAKREVLEIIRFLHIKIIVQHSILMKKTSSHFNYFYFFFNLQKLAPKNHWANWRTTSERPLPLINGSCNPDKCPKINGVTWGFPTPPKIQWSFQPNMAMENLHVQYWIHLQQVHFPLSC